MSLRAYDDLAQYEGLTSGIASTISSDTMMGKLIAMAAPARSNKTLQRIILIGCGVWAAIFFFVMIPTMENNTSPMLIFPMMCAGPLIFAGVAIGGYSLLMSTLLGIPQTLMSTVVLKRGDELQIHYIQPIKRNVTLKSMAFSLVLQESATYDQGSSTVTVKHDHVIQQEVFMDVAITPDTGIDQQMTFIVPDDAMHTFEVTRNSLQWYVRVNLDIPNFPDYHKDYKVKVLAEVNDES